MIDLVSIAETAHSMNGSEAVRVSLIDETCLERTSQHDRKSL